MTRTSKTMLRYHDYEISKVEYSIGTRKLSVWANMGAPNTVTIILSGVIALNMEVSGGQIVISRIEIEEIGPDNIETIKLLFRAEEQIKIEKANDNLLLVSVDTHIGMSLLIVCEGTCFVDVG